MILFFCIVDLLMTRTQSMQHQRKREKFEYLAAHYFYLVQGLIWKSLYSIQPCSPLIPI